MIYYNAGNPHVSRASLPHNTTPWGCIDPPCRCWFASAPPTPSPKRAANVLPPPVKRHSDGDAWKLSAESCGQRKRAFPVDKGQSSTRFPATLCRAFQFPPTFLIRHASCKKICTANKNFLPTPDNRPDGPLAPNRSTLKII